MANDTRNIDTETAVPRGDTGDGNTGVPANEQGISNRPGDKDEAAEGDVEAESEEQRQAKLARDGGGF